jgi:hypothetical protein
MVGGFTVLVQNSGNFRLIVDVCFKFVDFSWTYVVSWIFLGIIHLKNISGLHKKRYNPLIDIFVDRPVDLWHFAHQQSTLQFPGFAI